MSAGNHFSNSPVAADIATGLHPHTNARLHEQKGPLIMCGGGIYVYDVHGNQYIESFAGLWSVAIGFSEPRLVQAAIKQMQKLPFYHTFNHMSHEPDLRLAEKLVEITPEHITPVSFTNFGVRGERHRCQDDLVLQQCARKAGEKKFLARTNGYHGITMVSGSLTGLPNNHRDFDLPIIPVIHLTSPHLRTSGQDGETEGAFSARLLKELEDTILSQGPPPERLSDRRHMPHSVFDELAAQLRTIWPIYSEAG